MQAAVDASGSGDTILIGSGIYTENVVVAQGVTLVGAGAGDTVIDGGAGGTTVRVAPGVTVSISDLQITNGLALDGGGVFNEGSLTLERVVVSGNSATDSGSVADGGGIANEGLLTVIDGLIADNVADRGGGIWNAGGSLTVTNSTVATNVSRSHGGGGIASGLSTSSVVISGSIIENNTVVSPGTDQRGGAGVWASHSDLTIEDSTIKNNDSGYSAGGIYVSGSAATFEMRRSTVSGNRTGTDPNRGVGRGAGISVRSSSQSTIEQSTISGNIAASSGGGIDVRAPITVRNSTISGNSADSTGGGVVVDASATFDSVTIAFNVADHGGGIEAFSIIAVAENTIIAANEARVSGNDCVGDLSSSTVALLTTNDCATFGTGSFLLDDPLLDALADNGGPTLTHNLSEGSPAVDMGITDLTVDQRDEPRPAGPTPDIGAVEVQAAPLVGIELVPDWGALGASIAVRSTVLDDGPDCGWSSGETVEIIWDARPRVIGSFVADGDGCFSGLVFLDGDEQLAGSAPGGHKVIAEGLTSGVSAQAAFVQVTKELMVTPVTGAAGAPVSFSGCGWEPSTVVNLFWLETGEVIGRGNADTTGCVTDGTGAVPQVPAGFYPLGAASGSVAPTGPGDSSATVYQVRPAWFDISPTEGPPGFDEVVVEGCSWFPGEQVEFVWVTTSETMETFDTDAFGCLTTVLDPPVLTLTIPLDATLGDHTIQARGLSSRQTAQRTFTVIAVDSDGDGVPDHLDQCPGSDDSVDVDGDGMPDGCDDLIDSDDDGVADSEDVCPGFDDNIDSDGDGIPDGCDSVDLFTTLSVVAGDPDGDGIVAAGSTITLEVLVANGSIGDATGVTAEMLFTPIDTDVLATRGPATCDEFSVVGRGRVLACDVGALAGNDLVAFEVDVTYGQDIDVATAEVTVSADQPDDAPGNNVSDVILHIDPPVDLGAALDVVRGDEDGDGAVFANSTVTFEVEVDNDSAVPATGVTAVLVLNPIDTDVLAIRGPATCDEFSVLGTGRILACDLGPLPSHDLVTFEVDVTYAQGIEIAFAELTVDAEEEDADPADNTAQLSLDITVGVLRALEVTQSIQDWLNSVPLIEDKVTVVRAFVRAPVSGPVTGVLHGTRDGNALPGSPLSPVNQGGTATSSPSPGDARDTLNSSLNFILPLDWREDQVTLRFEGVNIGCAEPAESNQGVSSDCMVTVDFTPTADVPVKWIAVSYLDSSDNTVTPSDSEVFEQMYRTWHMFPISGFISSLDSLADTFDAAPHPADVNTELEAKRVLDQQACNSNCDEIDDILYVGVLNGNGASGTDTIGKSDGIPGLAASGYTMSLPGRTDTGRLRHVVPHEVGHALGVPHTVDSSLGLTSSGKKQGHCDSAASATVADHPYHLTTASGATRPTIGPTSLSANEQIWGFDVRFATNDINDLAVISPFDTWELMSYCDNGGGSQGQWIGEPQYLALYESLKTTTASASEVVVSSEREPSDNLMLVGEISPDGTSAEITATYGYRGIPSVPPSDGHELRLLDAAGDVITTIGFTPIVFESRQLAGTKPDPTHQMILATLPVPDRAVAAIEIIDEAGAVLGTTEASSSVPQVDIIEPREGSVFDGDQVTFSWRGRDRDSDHLRYTVLYSSNAGDTWNTLSVGQTEDSLTVDRSVLVGSEDARLQVVVTDGLNTATATSGPFTVAASGPIVDISVPENGIVLPGDGSLLAFGAAFDREEGMIDDTALVWRSDIDGVLGTGPEIVLYGSQLSPGPHLLTLSATDSDGMTGRDSVWILVDVPSDTDIDADGLTTDEEISTGTDPRLADTDGDGLVDGLDPSWIQQAVMDLDDSAFAATGHRRAIVGLLDDVAELITVSDVGGASDKLHELRSRLDGCGDTADSDDWIIDCDAQIRLRALIDLLLRELHDAAD